MLSYVKKIASSGFVRNVAVVVTGTAGAQAIAMAFVPIVTRLYGPETLGALGTFTALLEILLPLAALSYPIALVLPKSDRDASILTKASLIIAAVISVITAALLLLTKDKIISTFNLQEISQFILLIPLAMFLSVCMAITNQLAIRKKLFRLRSRALIAQSLVINITKTGLGFVTPTASALINTTIFGYLFSALILWPGVKDRKNNNAENNKKTSISILIEYKDFALYRTPQTLLNSFGQSLPILMLSTFFGTASVGFYALSRTVLFVPSTLLGQSVADVFYPKFSEIIQNGKNGKNILIKTCLSLALVGAIPYLALVLLGPWIFSILFGDDWTEAGEYARWMSVWLYFVLISRPVVAAIPVLSLQGFFLIFEIVALAARALAIFFGYQIGGSALSAVISFSMSNVFIYAILMWVIINNSSAKKI